jgi:hypothetical protein
MRRMLVLMVVFVGLAVGVGVSADTGALPEPLQNDGSLYTWPASVVLQVSPVPWGAGYVESPTRYIDCPFACIRAFDRGAVVTLEAHPSAHYTLTGWAVANHGVAETPNVCPGTELCVVTLDQAKDVVALFKGDATTVPRPPTGSGRGGGGSCGEESCTLTVTVNSPTSDNSVSDGGQFECRTDGESQTAVCTKSYAKGTVVDLQANTDGGSFDGWGGACSGNGGCTVTMNKNRSVGATFSTDS